MDAVSAGIVGREMLAAGQLEKAEFFLSQALKSPESAFKYCQDYLLVLVKQDKYEFVLRFLEFYPVPLRYDMLFYLLHGLFYSEQFSAIDSLWRMQPSETFEKTVSTLWKAASLYHQKDHASCIDLFQRAAEEGTLAWSSGNKWSCIPSVITFGLTLSKAHEVHDAEQYPEHKPSFDWILASQAPPTQGPITIISGDDRYVLKFAEKALEGLHVSGLPPLCHIHLIGGSPAVYDLIQALHAKYPGSILGVTVEPTPTHHSKPYFASARFLMAPTLLQHYEADLIIADIDSAFTPEIVDLTDIMQSYDVGFYQDAEGMPWIDFLCGLVYVRKTDETRRFLHGFANILRQKIYVSPMWMIDQGCLYSAAVYFSEEGVKICDFQENTGHSITHVLTPLSTREEKKALRTATD